jgi:hypothetical protein
MKILPNIDEIVLQTLDFFLTAKPPKLSLDEYHFPLVVGSGNAYNTGMILFADRAAIFADESSFRSTIQSYLHAIQQKLITQAIVISASGEKDSVWEIELAKKYGLSVTLLTCNATSPATAIADKVVAYRKIAEPYTYNTSTYLGMILSATQEVVAPLQKYIQALELPPHFDEYQSYSFVLPDRYESICPMLDIKKNELFGSHLSLRAFSEGHARHAKFVIPSEEELVIGIGVDLSFFGHPHHRWLLPLPENADFGALLAITYFITGKIQASKHPYFKENIEQYCLDYGPKAYGKNTPFEVIVSGN